MDNNYINSFIGGLTRDIAAVKNAIIYDYNNGLAEGSVNKLKVIKRIMYDHNSFDMLRKSCFSLKNGSDSTNFGKNQFSLDKYKKLN